MKKLFINVTTYVPRINEGNIITLLEERHKLLPSLKGLYPSGYEVIINVVINNTTLKEVSSHLDQYMRSNCKFRFNIYSTNVNSLTKARNFMLEKCHETKGAYVTFMDDDDAIMPNAPRTLNAVMDNIDRPEFQNKLNFLMFKWERTDGDFLMPKDVKIKSMDKIGRSTFTFSSWGWISTASYLVNNMIKWPAFIESPKLEDNYFHIRSVLVNKSANFILSPFYLWNNRDNMSSMSNGKREYVDELMEYFKTGNVGYDMTPYVIRDQKLVELKDLADFDYPIDDLGRIYIKGLGHIEPDQVKFDYTEMCYFTNETNPRRLRNLININDFMKSNSTHQLRLMSNMDSQLEELYLGATTKSDRSINGKPNYDSIYKNCYIAEVE